MRYKNIRAFTLTELIVVITILAILGTLGFLSYGGFVTSARNSNRISDMKIIERAMSLYATTESSFPLPDSPVSITFSGGLAWTQGKFGETVISQIQRISNIPIDPVFGSNYSYSVTNTGKQYSVASVLEDGFFSHVNSITPTTYAISSDGLKAHVVGNYILFNVGIVSGSGCSVITAPSIILSDIPPSGDLVDGNYYSYSFINSRNIPQSYSGFVDSYTSIESFQISEILNICTITSINQLKLYIAKLATSYQQLASNEIFESLVYGSSAKSFQLTAVEMLQENGIIIDPTVLDEILSPTPFEVFVDTFTDTSGISLVSSHVSNDGVGSWVLQTGNTSDYTIESNKVQKNTSTPALISPNPFPNISSQDYSMSFDIEDFGSGNISLYLRYTDVDNYYKLTISESGYVLMRRLSGVDSIFSNINDPITHGSTINFGVESDTLTFGVDGIEKENILASGIVGIGYPAIDIQNIGARIDNYSLTYK